MTTLALPDARPRMAAWFGAALASILIVAAGLAAYSNSFNGPFVLDDDASIVENASIRHLQSLGSVLMPSADAGVGQRPLANLFFALNYATDGTAVRSYHVVSLVIHRAVAMAFLEFNPGLPAAGENLARLNPSRPEAKPPS